MNRILLVLLSLVLYSCQGVSQTFEGVWQGEVRVQGTGLSLVFDFSEDDGSWSGTMQSPKQAAMQFPLSMIKVAGDSVFLEIKNLGLSYSGQINASGDEIDGIFNQNGLKLPLVLTRGRENVNSGEMPKRPQEPHPPYTYDTLDVTFKNTFQDIMLAGTLTQPKVAGKFPAVILVTGSGSQNRDEEMMGHKPFKVLADFLTKQGIVVLRYDDRGIGQSEGDFATSTIGDFSKDALSALQYLKSRTNVDASKVGMIGHSEGGLIALLLAGQQAPDLRFLVSLAGPALPIDSLMLLQTYHVGKVAGMSEKQLAEARVINRKNFEVVKSQLPPNKAMAMLKENMKPILSANDPRMQQEMQIMLMKFYRYFLRIDPVPFIRKIQVPVFALFGELDIQVPHAENMESLADNLPKNPKSEIKTYSRLNHLFQPAETGAVQEYSQIETTMDEVVLKDIADWIKSL